MLVQVLAKGRSARETFPCLAASEAEECLTEPGSALLCASAPLRAAVQVLATCYVAL